MGKLDGPVNGKKAIGSFELLALLGVLIGEIKGGHALPRPAVLGAVFLFYGLLGAAAEMGGQAARAASAIAGVTTLGALVTGAAGKNILGLLNALVGYLPGAPQPSSSPPSNPTA